MGSRVRNFFSLQFRLFHHSQLLAVQPQGVLDVKNKNPQSTLNVPSQFKLQFYKDGKATDKVTQWVSQMQWGRKESGLQVWTPSPPETWLCKLSPHCGRWPVLHTHRHTLSSVNPAALPHKHSAFCIHELPLHQTLGWQHPLATFWPQIYKYTIVVMRFKC